MEIDHATQVRIVGLLERARKKLVPNNEGVGIDIDRLLEELHSRIEIEAIADRLVELGCSVAAKAVRDGPGWEWPRK